MFVFARFPIQLCRSPESLIDTQSKLERDALPETTLDLTAFARDPEHFGSY